MVTSNSSGLEGKYNTFQFRKLTAGFRSPKPVSLRLMPCLSDDMMEHDSDSLRDRLIALEKRVLDQNDEIVCLRSTVADVLRRVNQLENVRGAMTPPVAAMTPTKDVLRLRPSYYDTPDGRHSLNGGGVSNGSIHKDVLRRQPPTTSASALSNRRSVQYQSTGSLLSDSPSSTSASPAPSPSPTQPAQSQLRGSSTNLANVSASRRGTMPTIQATPSASPAVHNVHFQAAKRWNSTSDFSSPHQPSSSSLANRRMTSSGSLLNLNAKLQPGMTSRHGTRDATFNAEDGYVKFYLRGRPIVVHAPTPLLEDYSLTKVNMAPSSKLKLEWVYGYRGRDCRSNLYLLPTGEMVYFTAAVVVLYNVEEQLQRHYLGHTDDVKCLAIHPNKLLIATGQCAGHEKKDGRPHIRIWNSVSLATLHVIGIGEFEKSISCLAFSRADGGNLLVAVDEAPDHNLSVWDWQKGERGQKICETKCSSELVVAAEFHPMDRHTLVTCGKSHICFWSLETGSLVRKLGLFETRDKPKYVTCLAFSDRGDVLSGDSNGNILVWGRGTNTVLKALKNAHEGPVFSLLVLKDGTIVSGGGKDGQIVSWDPSYRRTGYVAEIPEQFGNVRTLAQGKGSQILIGTTRNCIVAGNFDLPFTPIVTGHTDEIWALCVHPNQSQFLSGGYDKLLHLWDTMSHSVIWSKEIGEPVQSATFSPDGSVIVVGTMSGRWLAMDAETKESYMSHTDGNEPLQVIKFSADGTLLAIGSRDNNIYVYQVSEDGQKYSRIGKCTGHSSFITHLDWCTDNVHFRTNSGDYELLFWNAGICRQVPQASQLRDLEWATETCVVSFTTLGIWPEGADGTDVNSVEKSHDGKFLVTGDDFGKVRLYGYPASQPKSLCYSAVGHSSHVTQVSFLHDDSRVVSAGGKDSSLLQWTIVQGSF